MTERPLLFNRDSGIGAVRRSTVFMDARLILISGIVSGDKAAVARTIRENARGD
jgi:hypothetical protein